MRIILILLFVSLSCAGPQKTYRSKQSTGINNFTFKDQSGTYLLKREVKVQNKRLITRSQIFFLNKLNEAVETSVTASQLGANRKTKEAAMLPIAAQFSVFLEKKEYKSFLKVDRRQKKIFSKATRPEKDPTRQEEGIPAGKYFCFFSQLPECLISQNILIKARDKKIPINIIWDSFPFNSEQYEGMPQNILTQAKFYYSQKERDSLRFELDLGNQIIFYHFDKQLQFQKMFWVSQGISIMRME